MTRAVRSLALAVLVTVAAACEVPTNDQPVELSGPFARLETTTTTAPEAPEVPGTTKDVVVYLLDTRSGTALVPVTRSIDINAGIQETLSNLFTQPPRDDRPGEAALDSAIPSSALLLSAQRSPSNPQRLVVDVRGLFGEQGVQGVRLRNALAQIVWTATVPGTGIFEVVFRSDAEPAAALVDDLQSTSAPVGRSDYAERT
jgi:spore germination protein GerM